MPETEARVIHVRAAVEGTGEERIVRGLAVPYGEIISIWGQREKFAPGSIKQSAAKLFARHRDAVGLVTGKSTDAGWEIEGKFSRTATADDAYTLTRDGVYDGMSVGFDPIEYHIERDELGDIVVYDEANIREVSVCPIPAYPSATVTEVREDTHHKENKPMGDQNPTNTITADEATEIRELVGDVSRQLTVLTERTPDYAAPAVDTRSAGQVLKAIVAGDEATIREYNELMERAYEGGTSADAAIKDGWVGDLTRIFDASSGVLADTFSTGTLPATGMNIEYAELDTNTITVEEQENEGDDLPMGKVKLKTRTAEVKTYGGATALSRQEIERSTLPILDRNLEALAMAAGVRKKIVLRNAYAELVAARILAGDTIAVPTLFDANDWLDAVVDAAVNFEDKGGELEALLVNASLFKSLNKLETEGHRIFSVDGNDKTIGTLDLTGLRGDIASLTVKLDTGAARAVDSAAFVNGRAIRAYDSSLVSLQDENVLNLTKEYSVYRYGAVAAEIPGFVVPVQFAA